MGDERGWSIEEGGGGVWPVLASSIGCGEWNSRIHNEPVVLGGYETSYGHRRNRVDKQWPAAVFRVSGPCFWELTIRWLARATTAFFDASDLPLVGLA